MPRLDILLLSLLLCAGPASFADDGHSHLIDGMSSHHHPVTTKSA